MKTITLLDYQLYENDIEDDKNMVIKTNRMLRGMVRRKYQPNCNKGNVPFSQALLILGKMLKVRGYNVIYKNLGIYDLKKITEIKTSDFIFFSVMTPHAETVSDFCKWIKIVNPNSKIFVGGYHVQFQSENFLKENETVDYLILSEVEYFISQLDQYGENFEKFNSIVYRKNQSIYSNDTNISMVEEKDIETPDYSLLGGNYDEYAFNFSTMRGCTGRCTFCVNGYCWGNPRYISFDKIKKVLLWFKENLPSNTIIHLIDNISTVNKKKFLQLCDFIFENDIKFNFSCDIYALYIDSELVKAMAKSGFYHVSIGFEDCNNEILKLNNKKTTFQNNRNAVRIIKENSEIMVTAYWMVGLPGSSYMTMNENVLAIVNLLREHLVDVISAKIFVPYPGTAIFKKPNVFGIHINNYEWKNYDRTGVIPVYYYDDISAIEIRNYYLYLLSVINQQYIQIYNLNSNTVF